MASSLQQRRKIGRQYLRVFGWFAIAVNCMLLLLLARRYFTGTLGGNAAYRYAVGVMACFVSSIVLLIAAKSE